MYHHHTTFAIDNPKMTNADWNHTMAYLRPAWGEEAGVAHPGRGASSSYFEATLTARDSIPPGMEIFINYGDNWDPDDGENDKNDKITADDHPRIDETIDKMIDFFEKHEAELDPQSKQEIYQFLIQDVLYAAAGTKKGKVIAALLPESPDGLKEVMENGGSLNLSYPESLRSLQWLAQHGKCMDNIRPGPSTIPHAGRGAFATRPMKAGAMVSPLPLVQIANSEIMNMHPLVSKMDEEDEQYFVRKSDSAQTGTQLLLNYCLGHPESKMLFLPSGAAASFINHSPEPNAKLVWSDHPSNHLHWFDLKPMLLQSEGNEHLGLVMEAVALKDIEEGEEVTIDYGPEWAAAWKEHLAKWEAETKTGSEWPIRALDYNNMFADKAVPINAEEYPENLMLKCFLFVKKPIDEPPVNENGEKVRLWTESFRTMQSENIFDCELTDVEEITTREGALSWNYTVKWSGKDEITWVKQVPQKALIFVDKPLTSDQHLPNSFRHYIGIPDEIFPTGPWRNINETDDEENEKDEADEGVEE